MLFFVFLTIFSSVYCDYLSRWDDYVHSVTSLYDIQPDCIPSRIPANSPVAFRGVVLLIHGFSACPQQYLDMAPLITEAGFDVLLTLLPGHGGVPTYVNNTVVDFIEYLPRDIQPYLDFAKDMNSIMEEAPGERVILGLSLGGTTAAYAASLGSSNDPTRSIYNRQLIAVPLLALPNEALQTVLELANTFPALAEKRIGWGQGCEVERAKGRQGICQFEVSQSAASTEFGSYVLDNVGAPLSGMLTQIMFDWNDPAVSVEKIQQLYGQYGEPALGKSVCTTPADGVHSFLSKYDNPSENKYWLNEFSCRIVSYVTQTDVDHSKTRGNDLSKDGYLAISDTPDTDPDHAGWPPCASVCTSSTCPYNRTNSTEEEGFGSASTTCPYYTPDGYKYKTSSASDDDGQSLNGCEWAWISVVAAVVITLLVATLVAYILGFSLECIQKKSRDDEKSLRSIDMSSTVGPSA